MDQVKQIALRLVGGHHPTCWGPNRTKRSRKVGFSLSVWLLELRHRPSPAIGLGLTPSVPLVLRPVALVWNFHPACRWQIMGLLGLHNCVNEFLIINFILLVFFLWRTLSYNFILKILIDFFYPILCSSFSPCYPKNIFPCPNGKDKS